MPLRSLRTTATTPADSNEPGGRDPSAGRWGSLLVVCLGVMMAFVNVSSTISALAAIQSDLHSSASQLVWITSAYSLAVVSVVMSAGTLGDLVGRRLVFLGGATVFAASSALAFLAPGPGVLIAAQAIMGIGGAAILPTSLSIISHAFADPRERTTAITAWAACSGLGLAVGPVAAGVVLLHSSWHAVFLTNVVLGVVVLVLAPLLVQESKHPTRRLDLAGVVLGTVAVASATFAIIEGGSAGYGSTRIVVTYVVVALTLALFVRVELRHPDPMLDLRLFTNSSFATVMAVSTTTMFGFVGIALLSVLYLERVQGLSALATGGRMLVMFASYIVVSAVAARVIRRLGFVVTLTAGLVLTAAGAFALLAGGPFDGFADMWPGLLVAGIGSGLLVGPATAAAINSVSPQQASMASATVNMFRQLGSVLGPSVLGTVVTSRFPQELGDRLRRSGVPTASVDPIVDSAAHGGSAAALPSALRVEVMDAVARAFTHATHVGLVIAGTVLLVMTVPTAVFVRHRAASS